MTSSSEDNSIDYRLIPKELLSLACSDVFEDILKKTFDEEDPLYSKKDSKGTQTTYNPPVKEQPIISAKKRFKKQAIKLKDKLDNQLDFFGDFLIVKWKNLVTYIRLNVEFLSKF